MTLKKMNVIFDSQLDLKVPGSSSLGKEKQAFFPRMIKEVKKFWQKQSSVKKGFLGGFVLVFLVLVPVGLVLSARFIPDGKKPSLLKKIIPQSPSDLAGDFVRLEIPAREAPFFTLEPKSVSKFGILPQQEFILKTRERFEADLVKDHLKSTVPVKIVPQGDRELIISPQNQLGIDQVFKVELLTKGLNLGGHQFDRHYKWAFQTQGEFRVVSHLPGDKKTKVPLDTGIEIVFSQDDYQEPEAFLDINPPIQYRLERHKETLAIVPEKLLQEKIVYTVTFKKGLNLVSRSNPIEEDFVFSFQTGEKEPQKPRLSLDKNFIQVSPQEKARAKVYVSNWADDRQVKAKIYQFPSSEHFIRSRQSIDQARNKWYDYYSESAVVSTDGLSLVSEADLVVLYLAGDYQPVPYLQLPAALSKGFYLIQFSYDGGKKTEQLWLQSTQLAGFVSVGRQQTVVWVNSLQDSLPVAEATVRALGHSHQSITDGQGISVFNTPEAFFDLEDHYLEITSRDQEELILPVVLSISDYQTEQEQKNNYWSYLYQERNLYKANDTIFFWGVIKDRRTEAPPESVKVTLDASRSSIDLAKSELVITPRPDGSFLESFVLADVAPGWYYLTLRVNGVGIDSSGFEVKEYLKPEMKIEIDTSKKAIFTNETVEYRAQVSFFDQTPASQIPLTTHESRGGKKTEIQTNRQGTAKYLYQPSYDGNYHYYPRYESVTFAPQLAQQGLVEGHGSVLVYGSKLKITTETDQVGNQATLKAAINHIDLSQINQGISSQDEGEPAPNHQVRLEITKTWWEKIEEGTYYDFVEKVTRPKYDYKKHEEKIYDTQLKTDVQGQINHQLQLEAGKSYKAAVTTEDGDGHWTGKNNHFYFSSSSRGSYPDRASEPRLSLGQEGNSFSLGEQVNVKVLAGEELYPDNEKTRFLFLRAWQGLQEVFLQESPQLGFTFEKRFIPNIFVEGIIFTGRFYQVVSSGNYRDYSQYYPRQLGRSFSGLEIRYKQTDSELDLKIVGDQNTYRPGQDAKVTVKVSKNGQPVSETSVSLVLVDEALEAIGGVNKPKILSTLYRSLYHQIYFSYYSHQSVLPNESGAEMGGGGGPREIFKDTAFFAHGQTDNQGEVVFDIKLPDNLTTWLVFAQAVNQALDAGHEQERLIVTQDFFVTSHFPKQSLKKDEPYLVASGFGVGINDQTRIDYQAIFLQGEEKKQETSLWGMAFHPVNFAFPQLELGKYRLQLAGKTGRAEDALVLPFEIKESRFAFRYDHGVRLVAGQKLTSLPSDKFLTSQPVRLIAADEGKGKHYWQLRRFCSYQGNRLEKYLALQRAGVVLGERFGEDSCVVDSEKISQFQDVDGGLSQVSWGGSHLETSVWAVALNPQPFDREKLAAYFEKNLTDTRTGTIQKAQAAWGLASLDKPRLNLLRLLAQRAVTY
ncbi:alpha-2-macroglobulin family protein, partial [Patescibacteria group bacterium]